MKALETGVPLNGSEINEEAKNLFGIGTDRCSGGTANGKAEKYLSWGVGKPYIFGKKFRNSRDARGEESIECLSPFMGAGHSDLSRFLSTTTILWFCDHILGCLGRKMLVRVKTEHIFKALEKEGSMETWEGYMKNW